jgi:hypothetical protein
MARDTHGGAAAAATTNAAWERYGFLILAVLLLMVLPLALDVFRLGLAAKYCRSRSARWASC